MIVPHVFDFVYHHRYFKALESENKEDAFVFVFERKTPDGQTKAKGRVVIPKPHASYKFVSWFFSTPLETFGNISARLDIAEAWFKEVVLALAEANKIYYEMKR